MSEELQQKLITQLWMAAFCKAVMAEIKELKAKRAELDKEIEVLKELGIV